MDASSFLRTIITGKNRIRKYNRKVENDVIGLDDERGLYQVEGAIQTSWRMASLDERYCLERQRTKTTKKTTYVEYSTRLDYSQN